MSSRSSSIKHRNYHTMMASALSTSPNSFYTSNDTPHLRPQEDLLPRPDNTGDLPVQHQTVGTVGQEQPEYIDSRITARTNSSDTLNTQERQQQEQGQPRCSCSRQATYQKNDETEDEDNEINEQQPLLMRRRNNKGKARTSWSAILSSGFRNISASLYLENSGSVARDHLANERTYLAWVRTSLSTISVGVGITQLFRLDRAVEHDPDLRTWGRPVGLIFICMSMVFLCFACIRYFHSQTTMTKGYFPASRGIILSTSAITFFSMVLLLVAVLFKR